MSAADATTTLMSDGASYVAGNLAQKLPSLFNLYGVSVEVTMQ